MPRPCKCRLVGQLPDAVVFKPRGVPAHELEAVELGLDELEAIRLADLHGLYHDAAAERMGVSRATFGRLIEAARHKVACALLGSKMIVFKGGPVMVRDPRMLDCADCGARFPAGDEAALPAECPFCHGKNLHGASEERGRGHRGGCGSGGGGGGRGGHRWRRRGGGGDSGPG